MDRLTGKEGVAKIIDSAFYDKFRPKVNLQIQLEGELMAALDQDPYLRNHIVQVWDVANVILGGKESMVIFEEYMDPDKQQPLNNARKLEKLTGIERLKLVEQLCNTVDKLAEYKIYHHYLSHRNIYRF